MKYQKQVSNFFTTLQYFDLIVATIAVLVFQFLPYVVCILLALISYCLGFGIMAGRSIFNCVEVFSASKLENNSEAALVTTSQKEVLNTKSERTKVVLVCILDILIFLFALLVLVTYPKG